MANTTDEIIIHIQLRKKCLKSLDMTEIRHILFTERLQLSTREIWVANELRYMWLNLSTESSIGTTKPYKHFKSEVGLTLVSSWHIEVLYLSGLVHVEALILLSLCGYKFDRFLKDYRSMDCLYFLEQNNLSYKYFWTLICIYSSCMIWLFTD